MKQQKKRKCVCKGSIVSESGIFLSGIFPITFHWFWNHGKFPILNATQSGGWHIHWNKWRHYYCLNRFLHNTRLWSWQGTSHPANSTNGYCMTWSLLQGPGKKSLLRVHLKHWGILSKAWGAGGWQVCLCWRRINLHILKLKLLKQGNRTVTWYLKMTSNRKGKTKIRIWSYAKEKNHHIMLPGLRTKNCPQKKSYNNNNNNKTKYLPRNFSQEGPTLSQL